MPEQTLTSHPSSIRFTSKPQTATLWTLNLHSLCCLFLSLQKGLPTKHYCLHWAIRRHHHAHLPCRWMSLGACSLGGLLYPGNGGSLRDLTLKPRYWLLPLFLLFVVVVVFFIYLLNMCVCVLCVCVCVCVSWCAADCGWWWWWSQGVGAEEGMQTSGWGNSGCCGCDWGCRLGCVDSLLSGCFGRAGGQLRAASCQQSSGVYQPPAVPAWDLICWHPATFLHGAVGIPVLISS